MRIFLGLLLAFFTCAIYADIDTSSLIKVTSQNNPKCVEYYHYKGELYCSTTAQMKTKVDPKVKDWEKQKIVFDERPWIAAWGKKTPTVVTIEYVPNGDDVNHWNELITTQFLPGTEGKVSLTQYVENIKQGLTEAGFNPTVNVIESSPDQVLFEFSISTPENMKQDELQLVRKGKDGYYILHYVVKKSDMGSQDRDKWIQNLKQSTIKE